MFTLKVTLTTILFTLILLLSCATTQLPVDLTKNYKLDLIILTAKPDKSKAVGVTTFPKQMSYDFKFEMPGKMNYVSLRTCSREITSNLDSKNWSVSYLPNMIEQKGNCPILIFSYNEQGVMSLGFILLEDIDKTLPARIVCGGNTENTNGVSVCQERTGNIEQISFDTEVITSPKKGCELESGNKGTSFTYKVKSGFCNNIFMETKAPNRIHLSTTYGYDSIQVRI